MHPINQIQMELPQFRYSPNAYKIDVFEDTDGTCSVCNQQRNIKYNSSFYSEEEPVYICPWCVADGSAAQKYNGVFNDREGVETPLGYDSDETLQSTFDEKAEEVSQRTPSYISWQQEVWLSHCNEPCAFIGYADSKAIEPLLHELEADIENAGYDSNLITEHMSKEGSVVGYLFQCLHCGIHRLHVDSD
jgi:uncharacterized protein CbrC (UPF0167 family)